MRFVVLMVGLFGVLLVPSGASARKQSDYTYRYEQVWSATVRMVRVDLRFPVRDQDPSIGYVLFDYEHNGRSYPGSVEMVRTRIDGVDYVRVVVQVTQLPSYMEQMLLDRLERKLRAEFGQPPPARRPEPPAAEEPDDDEGGDEGDEAAPDEGDEPPRNRRRS